MLFFLLFSQVQSFRPSEGIQHLLKLSSDQDYDNSVTCKRPSVKSMVNLWEAYPNSCILHDKHSFLSIKTERFQFERGTEVRFDFVKIWGKILEKKEFFDSWRVIDGEGVNDKGGLRQMLYDNVDSSYLLGEKDQLEATIQAVENDGLEFKGDIDTHLFITHHLAGLLSGFYLTSSPVLKEKAVLFGEKALKFYKNWHPFARFNFETNHGIIDKIHLKQFVNLGEFYILFRLTKDQRYEKVINDTVKALETLTRYEVLPEFASFEKGKVTFSGFLTGNSESAQVQRILWNNWKLSKKSQQVFRTLMDINKKSVLSLLPFTTKQGDVVMIERRPEDFEYRMNLKMCAWAGVLAEENRRTINSTEMILAQKLFATCIKAFRLKEPADFVYLDPEKIVTKVKGFSIPGEIFESLFFIWRSHGDHSLRKLGIALFAELKNRFGKRFGFAGIGSELMPQDFLSKSLKYLFLTQASHTVFLGAQFNTEGHLLGTK
jgi:hypothetical protein